jgi:DNA polymerase-3 subunit beta
MQLLKAPQSEILAAVKRVAAVAPARSTLPIIQNILVRKTGGAVALTATDLDLQASTSADLGGDACNFATTVAAKRLLDVLHAFAPDQVVTVVAKGDKLLAQGGRNRFTIGTIEADGFPLMTVGEPAKALAISQRELRAALKQVAFAMAVADVRYYLNGALLSVSDGVLTCVASDGHQIAKVDVSVQGDDLSVILHRNAVLFLVKALGDVDDVVRVRQADRLVTFDIGTVQLVSKLVDGRFPDFQRVIPRTTPHTIAIGRAPALRALQAVAIMTTPKFQGVRLTFTPGLLKLEGSVSGEEAESALEIDYEGPEIVTGFNAKMLADGLSSTEDEMVRLHLTDGLSGMMLSRPAADASYRYVLMPMRL